MYYIPNYTIDPSDFPALESLELLKLRNLFVIDVDIIIDSITYINADGSSERVTHYWLDFITI